MQTTETPIDPLSSLVEVKSGNVWSFQLMHVTVLVQLSNNHRLGWWETTPLVRPLSLPFMFSCGLSGTPWPRTTPLWRPLAFLLGCYFQGGLTRAVPPYKAPLALSGNTSAKVQTSVLEQNSFSFTNQTMTYHGPSFVWSFHSSAATGISFRRKGTIRGPKTNKMIPIPPPPSPLLFFFMGWGGGSLW